MSYPVRKGKLNVEVAVGRGVQTPLHQGILIQKRISSDWGEGA